MKRKGNCQLCPSTETTAPTMKGAKIAPMLVEASKTPVAKARSFFGNHSATVLIAAGKLPDSPIPRPKRAIINPIKLNAGLIAACNIPKKLHIAIERVYPILVPSLSIVPPMNNKPAP